MERKLTKLLLVVMLLSGGLRTLRAQRSDTIWQELPNISGVPAVYHSATVNNIGQTGHTAYITITGPGTCFGNTLLNLYFESSWDNSSWTIFGNQTSTTSSTLTAYATGAVPYVRISATYIAGCTIQDVFYTGVIYNPSTLTQGILPANAPQSLIYDWTTPNPLVTGKVAVSGIGANKITLIPDIEGQGVKNVSVPVGTTVVLFTKATGSNIRSYINDLVLSADTNATVVTIKEGSGVICATSPTTLGTFLVNAGAVFHTGKFKTQILNDDLCLSSVVGTVSGMIMFGSAETGGGY